MAEIRITLDAREYRNWLSNTPRKLQSAIDTGLKEAAFLVERLTKQKISLGYFKNPTGRLQNSISVDLYPNRAEIGPHVHYAVYVHEGTRYIKARPFLSETLNDNDREIQETFDRRIEKALQ